MSASENGHTGGYTPGPWRAVRGDELVFVEVVNIAHIGVSGGDANKAQFVVQAAPGSKGSLPHDALLIAASPEMLEALKAVMEEKAPRYHDCTDDGLPKCAWCLAEEAISKAEGGAA